MKAADRAITAHLVEPPAVSGRSGRSLLTRMKINLSPFLLLLAATLLAVPGCRFPPEIVVVEVRNGDLRPPAYPFLYEDLRHPRLEKLRIEERLEDVVAGEPREFAQFVRLRGWARGQWVTVDRGNAAEPYPDALAILSAIRTGRLPGGICSEFAAVFAQAALALGHQTRLVSLQAADGRGHRATEVWSNEYDKWILMDTLFDAHFERRGIPLGAHELHTALLERTATGIEVRGGRFFPSGTGVDDLLPYFTHLAIVMRNNHASLVDRNINRLTLSIRDGITDGRPDFSRWVSTRGDVLEGKVNQTKIDVGRGNAWRGRADLSFETNTPGFSHFEARVGDGEWKRVGPSFSWDLRAGENRLVVRSRNLRNIPGPPASIRVSYRPVW